MLVEGGAVGAVVVATTLVMAVPGLLGLITPALVDEHTHLPEPVEIFAV